MFKFEFTEEELAVLSQVLFSEKVSFSGNMVQPVASLQMKLKPTIDTLIATAKKGEVTPTTE